MPQSPASKSQTTFGSMVFCHRCGNLLESLGQSTAVTCEVCSLVHSTEQMGTLEVVTHSAPSAFPSVLKSKRGLVQQRSGEREQAATIAEACPQCGAPEMSFHTMQLRSADEGQTVFYNCVKCGHKFSVNS
ncbi:transcription factor S-II-domain-containing protein [Piptocephalis cylindrospora]|uniref:DNA-directed RNA polymerase subunit n=1 Tax=Piptocephalis cylindrospora TaxID=1907219 RepID=A0A4P9Y5J0_9FUNG|nr:transcription factor S-II-domain-containing protein [Piptocephalis cylindrospora]|eukprot:RKP13050.1 transcription factor S-II-domain-containing protein [Piptocephalis cylindrospora]